MSTETDTNESESFEAFEARILSGEPEPADEPQAEEENPETNDELELEEGDELVEDEDEKGDRKSRSKPLRQRLGEVSEKRRLAEARAAELEAENAQLKARLPQALPEPTGDLREQIMAQLGPAPNPEDFDKYYGEDDPAYQADRNRYEARLEARLEIAQDRQREQQEHQAKQVTEALTEADNNWKQMAEKAIEADPEFQEVLDAAAANEWPLLPHSAAAVAASESGADIARYLNDNRDEANKLARAEAAFHNALAAAKQAGLPETVAMALAQPAYDRAVEIFEGIETKAKTRAKPEPKRVTDAPEPVRHAVRGAGGKFGVDDDTEDFTAFEAKYMNGKK